MDKKTWLHIVFTDKSTFDPAGHERWFIDENILVIEYPDYKRCYPMTTIHSYEFTK